MPGMRHAVHTPEYPSLCRLPQPFIVCLARLRALQLILQLQYTLLTPAVEVTCISCCGNVQHMQHKQHIPLHLSQQLFVPVTVTLINLQLWKALNINYN